MSRLLSGGSTQCRSWCGRIVGAALGITKGIRHKSDSLGKASFLSGTALRPFRETRLSARVPHSYLTIRMVEGHQCHRVGHAHRKQLMGQRFIAQSPNGRFTEGAQAINQQLLTRIEVHGKNLFYFFGEGDATVVLHIHFGMSGAFKTVARGDTLPEPKETTRLVLIGDDIVGQLSAMIVQHGGLDLYEEKKGNLGPDPLREDADKELLWERMHKSKASVGLLLMDQKAVAGIGNIYRAEILYKAKVHPEQPGYSVDRETFERIWFHSVDLLQRGFKSGSILTVDPEDAQKLGKPWTRRYIYNHKACGRCGTSVRTWDMSARTCYACEVCQPLQQGTILDAKRTKALSAARNSKVFDSHCAPEPVANMQPEQLTIAKLKDRLKELNLPLNGRKAELVERLKSALQSAETLASEEKVIGVEDALENVAEAAAKMEGVPELAPGTLHVGKIMSAKEAALEKAKAGEGRNVEHVALEDDATLALASAQQPKRRKRKQAPEVEQNGAAPKATQTEQYAEPQRARRKGKQSAAAAKREPVEASAADADKSEAAQPKRRAKKAAAAKQDDGLAVEPPLAKAASGKLEMRQRRSARVAAGPALQGASGRARGISGGVGLDTPYDWGK
ncbi:g8750 [Coccomyxa viridis]|uniref:DNA-(apurinic or apyrimidinic site) lyase n=1 Tax=Coccomyxa viridis TaxID=1274662 RepID=A0ABP1G161_9CHLO